MYINFVCVLKVNIRHTDGQTITYIPNDRQTVTHTQTDYANEQTIICRQTEEQTHTHTHQQTDSVGDYRGVVVDHFVR